MPLLALTLLLVLSSAFLHAFWNALLKKASNLEAASVGILTVSLVTSACIAPFLPGRAFPDAPALLWGLAAGIFEGFYFLSLAKALRNASLGWTYTWMRGGSILLVWPLSLAFLGESLHALSALSVLVVCAGLLLMGLVPGRGAGGGSLKWAGAVAASIAGFTLCYKVSLGHGAQPVPLYAVSMAVSLPMQVAARVLRRGFRKENFLTSQWVLVGAAGLMCAFSFLLYLEALALGGAGVMATLRNTSVVFAVLFSLALGERPTVRQWVGACLVTAGAVGLAWPT